MATAEVDPTYRLVAKETSLQWQDCTKASSPTHPLIIKTPVISQAPQLLITLITIEKKLFEQYELKIPGHLYASVPNYRNFEGTVFHDQEDLINKKQYLVIIYCYSLIPLSLLLFLSEFLLVIFY